MKKVSASFCLIFSVLLCLSGCMFSSSFALTDNNIDNYLNSIGSLGKYERQFESPIDKLSAEVLPKLNDLPEYEDIFYQYYIKRSLWSTETMLLIINYDEHTYVSETEKINESSNFLNHTVSVGENYLLPEYEFSVGSFEFMVIQCNDDERYAYPHRIGMIAMSDEKKSHCISIFL